MPDPLEEIRRENLRLQQRVKDLENPPDVRGTAGGEGMIKQTELDRTRERLARAQLEIDKLHDEIKTSDAMRFLMLDEFDHLKRERVALDVTEALIEALRDACAFAANQVSSAPPGAALRCIGRWRYAIDRVRGRYIGAGAGKAKDVDGPYPPPPT